ncbi:MAG: hypothetical protein QOI42_840 [Frankiaceae bacterium]|jgi:hypothetical protein|nr:hypothetical protein [Frankiaceae bacterium]
MSVPLAWQEINESRRFCHWRQFLVGHRLSAMAIFLLVLLLLGSGFAALKGWTTDTRDTDYRL